MNYDLTIQKRIPSDHPTKVYRCNKTAKAPILDEFCATCAYNRKYAIRLLNATKRKQCKKHRRPDLKTSIKPKQLLQPFKRMWFATDQMCSKKLKAAIPLWLPFYERSSTHWMISSKRSSCHEPCNHRSHAQTYPQPVQEGSLRYQTWHSSEKPNTHSNPVLGNLSTRLP